MACQLCNIARGHLISVDEFKMLMAFRVLATDGNPWRDYQRFNTSGNAEVIE